MVTTTIAISMYIEPLNVGQSLCGHQTNQQIQKVTDYNWDYNTRQSCHYYQEYGNILDNYIRTHFSDNYNIWLSQTTCFNYLKIGHINKYFPTRSKAPNSEFKKGKGKVDVEHIKGEMNKTWKRRYGSKTSNGGITSPKRSSGHSS